MATERKLHTMKKTILLISILLFTIQIFSQSAPTGKIKKALKSQYPEATDAKWNYEGDYKDRVWKALYQLDDVLHSSWYDYKGNWIQTKVKIDPKELPAAVLKSIDEDYARYHIVIAARFQNPELDGFEVFLDSENMGGYDVQYTADGKYVHRTMKSSGYKAVDDKGNQIEE